MALFRFLAEHEEDLRKQFLVILDYYQHRDLYGSNAQAILRMRADRYGQAIKEYVGLPDARLYSLLENQINGLLTLRMIHGTTVPFVEQARPFVEMFAHYVQNTSGETEEHTGSSKEAEQHEERKRNSTKKGRSNSYDNDTSKDLQHPDQSGSPS
jgi:hypothetical protein